MAKVIIVTSCFIDCPYARYDDGMGFCASYWMCDKMVKCIKDGDHIPSGKWNQNGIEIHPNCPLKDAEKD